MTRVPALLLRPGGVLAAIRLAAIPVFFAAERLVDHPEAYSRPFGLVLGATALYAVAALGAEARGRELGHPWALAAADLALIAALVETSGGPFSQLRYAFFLVPIGTVLLLRPRLTALASAAGLLLYVVIALTYPERTEVRPDAVGFELTQAMFLAWMGAAATLLTVLLARRTGEVEDLAASRQRLVAQALDAEDGARRRLAEVLHDEALQNILAARQELGAGDQAELDLVREALDESVGQLRQAVFDLHPYLLEQAGLRAALRAVAERAGRRGGWEAEVWVDQDATERHDQLVFSIARELLANAAKHSGASHVRVAVERTAEGVELEVADDGRGIDLAAVRAAPEAGHIGLASCAERAESVGGSFAIEAARGGVGTRVRVVLPVGGPASPAVPSPPRSPAAA